MFSTNTYTQTIPYFYIIRHIESNKMYAGSRYAKNCHPSEFMTVNGYTTSSSEINYITGHSPALRYSPYVSSG